MLACDACGKAIDEQPMFAVVGEEFQKIGPGITHLCNACRCYCDEQLSKLGDRLAQQRSALREETFSQCIDAIRGRVS